jgi:hypothetical protein
MKIQKYSLNTWAIFLFLFTFLFVLYVRHIDLCTEKNVQLTVCFEIHHLDLLFFIVCVMCGLGLLVHTVSTRQTI